MSTRNIQTTVDEKELAHFRNFEHWELWWSEKSLLRKMNPIRISFIEEGLVNTGSVSTNVSNSAKPFSGLRMLDVGCGGGVLSEPLAEAGAMVTGMDASAEVIQYAKLHAKRNEDFRDNNLHYVYDTVEHFCENKIDEYDVVVASEILEHVTSPDLFLKSCVKMLKVSVTLSLTNLEQQPVILIPGQCKSPGGSIFVTTINKTTWSWLKAIVLYEHISGTIPEGTHEWDKFISPESVGHILNRYNCKVKAVSGWQYNIWRQTWSKTKDLSCFYLLHAVRDD